MRARAEHACARTTSYDLVRYDAPVSRHISPLPLGGIASEGVCLERRRRTGVVQTRSNASSMPRQGAQDTRTNLQLAVHFSNGCSGRARPHAWDGEAGVRVGRVLRTSKHSAPAAGPGAEDMALVNDSRDGALRDETSE